MPNLFNYPETQPQSLDEKIKAAVEFLQKAEKLALKMQPSHGFWLAFSGGKDSCVILELARMAGVKFTAYYNVTTIDPPELVRFIIEKHPEVVRLHPKKTFFRLIKERGILPIRQRRFCCEVLKENSAAGYCTIVGVRKAESVRRARQAAEIKVFKKKEVITKSLDDARATKFDCVGGKDRVTISPILEWTDNDVWDFIRKFNVPYCSLYDEGFSRLGCLFCPMSRERERERERALSEILCAPQKGGHADAARTVQDGRRYVELVVRQQVNIAIHIRKLSSTKNL